MTWLVPRPGLETIPLRPVDATERQRQRAGRRREYLDRLGRDEQRIDRGAGPTYLVFADRASADEVMREVAATPVVPEGLAWPVLIWDEEAAAAIGTFEAADGRVAVGHPWTSAETAWIARYVAGWRAVEILDALPADWRPKGEEEPARR